MMVNLLVGMRDRKLRRVETLQECHREAKGDAESEWVSEFTRRIDEISKEAELDHK